MEPVDIQVAQGALVIRARNSEILIMPNHAQELLKHTEPKKFSQYFLSTALVNRPARKLFEAWLKKDRTIWPRLYKAVQDNIKADAESSDNQAEETSKAEG